jgi:hypothetical protein
VSELHDLTAPEQAAVVRAGEASWTEPVGRPADGATPIALSAQLEAARPWAHRRPPMG